METAGQEHASRCAGVRNIVRKPILPNNVLRRCLFPACATLNLPNATWLSGLDSFRDHQS
jgi:hypothetical protein